MLDRRPRKRVGAQALLTPPGSGSTHEAEDIVQEVFIALVFDGFGKILDFTVAGLYK
jgi:hypothetical protein